MPWTVNGEVLDDEVIRQEARLVHAKLVEAMTDDDPLALQMRAWEWARENVIERVLLRQAAVHDPAPLPDGMVQKAVEALSAEQRRMLPEAGPDFERQVEIQLRVERLVSVLTSTVPPVSNKEAAEYYKKHRESFFAPEMVRVAHIVKNGAGITAVQEALRAGRSFEEVADEMSDCPGRGGELGWIARGQMVDEFDAVVFGMREGEVSEIFQTTFGFHIARVLERRSAGIRPLDEVREDIASGILNSRREDAVNRFVDALRSRAEIRKT